MYVFHTSFLEVIDPYNKNLESDKPLPANEKRIKTQMVIYIIAIKSTVKCWI